MISNFRPKLAPTIITFFAFILLITLGSWQVKRLFWKNELLHSLEKQLSIPAEELESVKLDINESKYRKVKVRGEFIHSKEIYVYNGSRSSRSEQGYLIFTPFKLQNNGYVLINRGWIPAAKKSHATRLETLIDGDTQVEGYLMPGERKTFLNPANNPEKNIWFWIDLDEMRNYTELELPDFYIMQTKNKEKGVLPIGNDLSVKNVRNNHLQYAITWYSLAIALLVIFYLSQRQNRK
jgi:surfeit locus 1 family protein